MKDTKLADMSVAQLQTVWQVVKAVEHSVNTAGESPVQGQVRQDGGLGAGYLHRDQQPPGQEQPDPQPRPH